MARKKAVPVKPKVSNLERENIKLVSGWRDRIKDSMKAKRVSQRKLAQIAGMGTTSIRHILMHADTTTLHTLLRIANALDLPIGYLATGQTVSVDDKANLDPKINRTIRILPLLNDDDFVVVSGATLPDDLQAMVVKTHAMVAFGSNEAVDASDQISAGDIVAFSPSTVPSIGDAFVCEVPPSGQLDVRCLSMNDENMLVALAYDVRHGRFEISKTHAKRKILQVIRRVQ